MTKALKLSAAAESDVEAAVAWYDKQAPGLGNAFIAEVEKATIQTSQYPEMHQVAFANVRRAVMHRFPYAVIYRVMPAAIEVLGVLPDRADPKLLSNRLAMADAKH